MASPPIDDSPGAKDGQKRPRIVGLHSDTAENAGGSSSNADHDTPVLGPAPATLESTLESSIESSRPYRRMFQTLGEHTIITSENTEIGGSRARSRSLLSEQISLGLEICRRLFKRASIQSISRFSTFEHQLLNLKMSPPANN